MVGSLLAVGCSQQATPHSATIPPSSAPSTTIQVTTTTVQTPTSTTGTEMPTSTTGTLGNDGTNSGNTGETTCPARIGDGVDDRLVEADVDGDSVADSIAITRSPEGSTTITVCTANGAAAFYDDGNRNKPATAYVLDIEGDGVSEFLVGGPTGAGPFAGTVVRFENGELVDLNLGLTVFPGGRTGSSFECVDVDNDGLRELLSISYEFDGESEAEATTMTWNGIVEVDANGPPGWITSGALDVATEANDVAALVDGTCGDIVIDAH